ncbi:hypothetical protein [Mycobacterium sp. 29Ha]|nr:hypothetical protein [Mycobacterium sp. 29Ha]MDV3133317.1 hypothetical protein [Mycobacterium sp. 29Ha]
MNAPVAAAAETATAASHPATVYFGRQLHLFGVPPEHFLPDPTEQSPDLH